jgi:hypothetical protein
MITTGASRSLWTMQISDASTAQRNTTRRYSASARSIKLITTGPMVQREILTHTHSLLLLLPTKAKDRPDQAPRILSHHKRLAIPAHRHSEE